MIIHQSNSDIFAVSESSINKPSNPVLDAKADISNIVISKRDGNYFIEAEDLYDHMKASGTYSVREALNNIIEFYDDHDIDATNIIVITDESNKLYQDLEEAGVIIQEKSTYSDASSIQKESRWYNKFIANMKKDPATKRDLEDRIDLLEKCVRQMERARKYGDTGDHVKYVFKALIPFNAIVRFLKDRDNMAGAAWAAGLLTNLLAAIAKVPGPGGIVHMVIRAATYNKMLDGYIKSTKEAIEFLKSKRKEFD